MNKLNLAKNKWVFALGGTIFFVLAVIIFFLMPNALSIKDKMTQLDALTQSNDALSKKLQYLSDLNTRDLEEKYQIVNFALLKDNNPYAVLSAIDRVVSKVASEDLNLGKIELAPGQISAKNDGQPAALKKEIVFDIPVKGKIGVVLDFLSKVEASYPLMSLRRVEGEFAETVDFKSNFVIHVAPETTTLPPLQADLGTFTKQDEQIFSKVTSFRGEEEEVEFEPIKFNRGDIFQ